MKPTGANYKASAGGVTAPKAALKLSHFIKMMITLRYLQCDYECIFYELDAEAYFSINSNSAIIMRINIANIPFMSPLSKNSGTKYTHRVNDKYLKFEKSINKLAESHHLGESQDLSAEDGLAAWKRGPR